MISEQALLDTAIYLTGPTASGKTAAGILLAEHLDGEILSLDSIAVYRGMDIGTAKPSAAERARVPHHLLDIADPSETYSVARYRDRAIETVQEILARGKQPIFVGGTPFYLKALIRGLFDGPPTDQSLRDEILEKAQEAAHEENTNAASVLHSWLVESDPALAAKIHPNDEKRSLRGLEVFQLTGTPLSEQQEQHAHTRSPDEVSVYYLDLPRPELYARINARTEKMFEQGLVEEVLGLREKMGLTARQAAGYREVIDYLDGKISLEDAKRLVAQHTRNLAKRQVTWMRNLVECQPITVEELLTIKPRPPLA